MPAAAAVRDWRAAAASLQRLDILTATEERGLQQCEMRLAKLGDEAVESHLASETLLIDLRHVVQAGVGRVHAGVGRLRFGRRLLFEPRGQGGALRQLRALLGLLAGHTHCL